MPTTLDTLHECAVPTQDVVHELARFIEERFPAEAANANMADPREVVQATLELLDRLWRLEH